MALNDLDHHFDSSYKILDECLTKGVEQSVELCVKTTKSMMASVSVLCVKMLKMFEKNIFITDFFSPHSK